MIKLRNLFENHHLIHHHLFVVPQITQNIANHATGSRTTINIDQRSQQFDKNYQVVIVLRYTAFSDPQRYVSRVPDRDLLVVKLIRSLGSDYDFTYLDTNLVK